MYLAKIYERELPPDLKFKRNIQKIPAPQFYVFYNGTVPQPAKQTISLRDAFAEADIPESNAAHTLCDLSVTVYNINEPNGKNEWEKCRALLDYSRFVNLARTEHDENPVGFMDRAIRKAIQKDIMPEYLKRNAKEVENMFFGEYDYDMDIAVQRGEAREEGIAIGIAEGEERGRSEGAHEKALETARILKASGVSIELISKSTGLSVDEINMM